MAASGESNLDESLYKGSGEDFDFCCEPCKNDGNFVEASGYCQNCNEYLCITCKKTHCRPKPCKNHIVLDKQQMPQNKPRQSSVSICTEICDKHPLEHLRFFCKKHDVTGCGDCIILNHKTCEVDYISTLSDGYNTSTEYTSVLQHVEKRLTEVNNILSDADLTATKAESIIKKTINNIKQYRKDVNAYIDEAERTLAAKCDEITKSNQRETEKIKDELKSSRLDLTAVQERLTTNVENTANLFVRAKESCLVLATVKNKMEAVKKVQLQYAEFKKNIALTSKISTDECLGTLQMSDLRIRCYMMYMTPQLKADISVVDSDDTKHCYITGMVHVRENIIACTDWFNKAVKLVDIKQHKLLSTVSLVDSPWDITSIKNERFAVTLAPISKIQFLQVKDDILSRIDRIDVKGDCRGIDCTDDKLVVSFISPAKVEILDFRGKCLQVIQYDADGNNLFKCPYYVAVSHDGDSVFVSDNQDNSVLKLSCESDIYRVVGIFKDRDIDLPHGIFVCEDGSLLVCSFMLVIVISDDCKEHQILLNEENGGHLPTAICYDEDNRMLCVRKDGDGSSDTIQTFRLVQKVDMVMSYKF